LEGIGCSLTEVAILAFVYSNPPKLMGRGPPTAREKKLRSRQFIHTKINIRFAWQNHYIIFILKVMGL
jgi:hypothetical protein